MIPADPWVPVGSLRKDGSLAFSLRSLMRFKTRYGSLYCGHCHRRGTLAVAVRGTTCPHCKKSNLKEWLSYVG
jgi:hypothetical protein